MVLFEIAMEKFENISPETRGNPDICIVYCVKESDVAFSGTWATYWGTTERAGREDRQDKEWNMVGEQERSRKHRGGAVREVLTLSELTLDVTDPIICLGLRKATATEGHKVLE